MSFSIGGFFAVTVSDNFLSHNLLRVDMVYDGSVSEERTLICLEKKKEVNGLQHLLVPASSFSAKGARLSEGK